MSKLFKEPDKDNLYTALSHLVLTAISARGALNNLGGPYVHPGVHVNYFIHGILGFFAHQEKLLNIHLKDAYRISLMATRCLALPCLNAELFRDQRELSALFLVSGVLPFILVILKEDVSEITHVTIVVNICALAYWAIKNEREWGYYATGASLLAYFATLPAPRIAYPLGLALFNFCIYRIYRINTSSPP